MARTRTTPLLSSLLAVAAVALAPACVGGLPDYDDPGDGPDAGVDPDPDPEPQGLTVDGMVMDYFTGDALPATELATEGLAPVISATAGSDGAFTLADVPEGSAFFVVASRDNYRPTRSDTVEVVEASVQKDVYVTSMIDVQRQYATLDIEMLPQTAFAIIDLRDALGQPLEGVPAADIVLLDELGAPAGQGPYFFGELGDVQSLELVPQSTAYNGRARAAFLNVPPGQYTVQVDYLDLQGNPMQLTVPVTALADGTSLVTTGALAAGGGELPANVTFVADVYPILQRAALGGDACANCHTEGGAAQIFQFDLESGVVYSTMQSRLGVIDLDEPMESMLLTKPLYEDPPNHPNATWLDTLNPSYQIVLRWIEQGAIYE